MFKSKTVPSDHFNKKREVIGCSIVHHLSLFTKASVPLSLAFLAMQPVQAQNASPVNTAPEIPLISDQFITAGEPFSLVVKPTDPDGDVPDVYAIGPQSAISFDDNGDGSRTFRWSTVQTDIGVYTIRFVARDAKDKNLTTSQDVTFTVIENPQGPVIAPPVVPSAPTLSALTSAEVVVGQTYTLVVRPVDEDGTVPGVFIRNPPLGSTFEDNLDGSRTFAWTPGANQTGLNNIVFVATDSADSLLSTESILQITVVENDNTPQNNPPAIVVDSTYTVQATDSIRIVITTTDADGTNPQLQVENLPDGTELTQTTDSISVLSWSPAEADVGRYVITLNAVDETDSTLITTKNISITVLSAPIEEEMIASTTVSTNGGTLELAGSGSVTFPDGAFENDNVVSIAISTDSAIQENFQTTAAVFKPSSSLGYEITIQTGNTPPLSDTVGVELDVPDEFLNSIPVGNQIELFAQVNEDSGLRIFEIFGADFDPQTNTLFADLPAAVFSNINSTTGEYEAVVTLASTPGLSRPQDPNQQPIDPGAPLICQAASIQCPLSNGCTVTVPFHAVGRHPITGAPSPHLGTNYQTADGDQVLAAADGIIEFSQSGVPGYGETMVLRHSDGSATLYGQLLQRNFQAGEAVLQGSVIATPNVPGSTIASDLRFEYVPNGSIFRSKNRIDPDACIDVLATGSITVRDDGSLADDAFEVLLDGVRLGATDIGASNNFALSNLIPGNKELSITAIVAPDDVGTLEITLDDGITFVDGNNYLSARLEQFETRTYTIIIP